MVIIFNFLPPRLTAPLLPEGGELENSLPNREEFIYKTKSLEVELQGFCGMDGTRTRDPLRDRQVF